VVTSEAECAWLAGLLEGEGSFMMTSQSVQLVSGVKVYRYPRITVNMTDRDVILQAANMFGNSVYRLPPQDGLKQQWRASTSGTHAASWMQRLYPWLGSRRRGQITRVFSEYNRASDFANFSGESGESLYWLAGILEGEGFFGMITDWTGGKVYRYPRIGVGMTDKDVIDRISPIFGNKTHTIPAPGNSHGYLTAYRAIIVGRSAAEWMRTLYPLMGQRRKHQIDTTLAEYDAIEPTSVRRSRSCSEAAAKRQRNPDGTFKKVFE
jgi:hypothetical protein